LLGYTRRLMHLSRHGLLAVLSYSTSTEANWLFLINVQDGSSERYAVPNGEIASHGASSGPDDNVYALTFSGNFYRFDVGARRWDILARPVPPDEAVWGSVCGANLHYYFGTYPNAFFGDIDLVTGEVCLWRHVVPGAVYCDSFSVCDSGRIRCHAWSDTEHWLEFDPATRRFYSDPLDTDALGNSNMRNDAVEPENIVPPVPDTEMHALTRTSDGVWYGVAHPSTRLCRVSRDGVTVLLSGDLGPGDLWRMTAIDNDDVCAVSMYGGFVRWRPSVGVRVRSRVDNRSPDANAIMFLEAAGPDRVVGANYSQQNLFDVNPDTGWWRESGMMVARVSGEPMCALSLGDKVYIGVYIRALMMEYDPTQPYRFGENPREIAEIGHGQTRPMGMCTDGGRVFMATHANYGLLDGALSTYDTDTGQVDTVHPLLPGHNMDSCAYDPATGHVFCGTDRWGDCGSHPATEPSAVVCEWSPEEQRVVRVLTPWEGADAVRVRGVLPGGRLVATNGAEYALIEMSDGRVSERSEAPWGHLHALRIGPDGTAYGLGDGHLFHWDGSGGTVTPLAKTEARHLAIPRPGRFVLAEDTRVLRIDLPDEKP